PGKHLFGSVLLL
ncbi:sulfate symporter transmembrane region family protein, partial [Chlamydia psittaci 84-8471/1]